MSGRYPVINDTNTYYCNSVVMEIGTSLEIGYATLRITGTLTSRGQLRLTNELANLYVDDLDFESNSTMYIPYNGANLYIVDDVYFRAGSNINPTYGNFYFSGSTPSITTNANAAIYNLVSNSTNMRHQDGGSTLTIKGNLTVSASKYFAFNTAALAYINGNVSVNTGGTLAYNAGVSIYIDGTINAASGNLQFNNGTLYLRGNTKNLTTQSGSYFNNLMISKNSGQSVNMQSNIDVNGNLTINSGSLVPGSYDINLGGNWNNYAGDNGFLCYFASNCVVTFDGTAAQNIYASEDFDQVRLNKISSPLYINAAADVWCFSYSRTSGILVVDGSLEIYSYWDDTIEGSIYVTGSLEINQTPGYSVNITGFLSIEGGVVDIYGGSEPAYFTNTGILFMNGGILAFHDVGISVQEGFSSTISGGILRTPGDLEVNTPSFDPTGGTIEFFGNTNSTISCVYGATLHHLQVNKDTSVRVDMASDLDINGNLVVASGIMRVYVYTLKVAGNLIEASTAYLQAPDGTLWLDGSSQQFVSVTAEFETLVLDNSSSAQQVQFIDANFTCDVYDWQDGYLSFSNSTFTAYDLADPWILGSYSVLTNSVVNLHQDASNSLICNGYMSISSGGVVNLHGGATAANFTGYLSMNSGVLNIVNNGISFGSDLIELVSGGTIVSHGSVTIQTPGLNLSGSTLQMLGSASSLNMVASANLGNLVIGAESSYVEMTSDARLSGTLSVQQGDLLCWHTLYVEQDVYIYSYMRITGTLQMNAGTITVQNGGRLHMEGNDANPVYITSGPGMTYYNFTAMPGSNIWAVHTIFEYMDANGINILDGAYVSQDLSFHHCTFRNGAPGGTLLRINTGQDLTLFDVNFPENTWGSVYNVSKTNNQGSLNFALYMGTFGGQSYEQDPNGRVNWSQMAIPPVENCSIIYLGIFSGSGRVRLEWDYPIAEATYNVYHSVQDPNGPYSLLTNVSNKYFETQIPTTTVKRFYKVSAILQP